VDAGEDGEDAMKRRIRLLPGAVEVSLSNGEAPEEIVPVLAEAARLALAERIRDLLVVSGYHDPATPEAVSMALEGIHALGTPPRFRMAFVAYTLPQYSAYHFAERYAERFGIEAKVLASLRDAKDWLGLRDEASATGGDDSPGSAGDRSRP
jgi:hypothetical protein